MTYYGKIRKFQYVGVSGTRPWHEVCQSISKMQPIVQMMMHIDDWRRQPCIKPNVDHAVVVSINAFLENTYSSSSSHQTPRFFPKSWRAYLVSKRFGKFGAYWYLNKHSSTFNSKIDFKGLKFAKNLMNV